jgi:hypothetical protein
LTKAEREKLLEEKNQVINKASETKKQDISIRKKRFFEDVLDNDDKNFEKSQLSITEGERALLKVYTLSCC